MTFFDVLNNLWPLILLLLPFAGAGAVHLVQLLDARLPAVQRAQLEKFAVQAVQSVEQRFKYAQYTNGTNQQKKSQAVQSLTDLVYSAKLPPPTVAAVDTLIEAAVYALPDTYDHTQPPHKAAPLFPKSGNNGTQPTAPMPTTLGLPTIDNRPITPPVNSAL